MTNICPKCDGQIDALRAVPWGDGIHRLSLAPYLCAWCASLFLIEPGTGNLFDIDELGRKYDIDAMAAMKANKALWGFIEHHRKLILSTPNRRPVLR